MVADFLARSDFFLKIAVPVLIIWILILSFFLAQTVIHYRRLTEKSDKKDLKNLLEEILKGLKKNDEEIAEILKRIQSLEEKTKKHLQKIGFLRFNPFSDTGGKQSFILSLLDEDNNGIVISSLHSRGTTRLYAKEVEKGKGKSLPLSGEEEKVVTLIKRRKI